MFVLLKQGLKQKNGVITYFVQQSGSKPLFLTPPVLSAARAASGICFLQPKWLNRHTLNTQVESFNSQLIVRISAGVGVWRFTLKNLHWYTWVTCIYIYSLSFHALMIKCREEKGSKNRWHFKREESEEKELESSCHEAGAETLDYWSQACRRESQPISLADKR